MCPLHSQADYDSQDFKTTVPMKVLPAQPKPSKQTITFLVPEDFDPANVRAALQDVKEHSTAQPRNLIGNTPTQYVGTVTVARRRRFKCVSVELFLTRKDARARKWYALDKAVLSLDIRKARLPHVEPCGFSSSDKRELDRLKLCANYARLKNTGHFFEYYTNIPADLAARTQYLILTTDNIINNSRRIEDFIRDKDSFRDMQIAVVTESRRYFVNAHFWENRLRWRNPLPSGGWGGGVGVMASENIRGWLNAGVDGLARWNYLGLDYLLLIGDPSPDTGDVPARRFEQYPENNFGIENAASSDYYYVRLSSNWDPDGNGRLGEVNPVTGCFNFDICPELMVGRIPVRAGNTAEVDAILDKTMAYLNSADTAWRQAALIPMRRTNGIETWHLGERIKATLPGSFQTTRVYDLVNLDVIRSLSENVPDGFTAVNQFATSSFGQDWYLLPDNWRVVADHFGLDYASALSGAPEPEIVGCNYEHVLSAWTTNPYGFAVWESHGMDRYVDQIFHGDSIPQLTDNHPTIIFSCACLNGRPENPDNLAASLLRNGAVACLAGGGSYLMGIEAIAEYFASHSTSGYSVGRALKSAIEELLRIRTPDNMDPELVNLHYCIVNTMLYGDPSLVMMPPE